MCLDCNQNLVSPLVLCPSTRRREDCEGNEGSNKEHTQQENPSSPWNGVNPDSVDESASNLAFITGTPVLPNEGAEHRSRVTSKQGSRPRVQTLTAARHCTFRTSSMSVPKTTMNKNSCSIARKDQIRFSWKFFRGNSESETSSVKP